MPGAPVTVTTIGVWSSTQRSNAATICASSASRPTNGAPPTISRSPADRRPDDRAAVAAELQLEAPARQLASSSCRRGPGPRAASRASAAARSTTSPVGPRAVDARAPRGDADRGVDACAMRSPRSSARSASSPSALRTPRCAHDGVAPELGRVGAARAEVREEARARCALGHVRRDDRRDEARAAALAAWSRGSRAPARTAPPRVPRRFAASALDQLVGDARGARAATSAADAGRSLGAVASRRAISSSSAGGASGNTSAQARRGRRHEARQDRDRRRPDVRRAPGDHLEERRAEGVEVGARVDLAVAARLLGRHVRGRPDDRPGARELRVLRGGDAEVDELDLERRRRRPGRCPTRNTFDGFTSRWTMPAACAAASASATCAATSRHCDEVERRAPLALRDVLALEPLHRDVRLPVVELPEGDDAHDPRVVQPREHAPLAAEARLFARVDARERDDLERDGLAGHLVVRAVHDPDAAAPDLALDDEAAREARCGERAPSCRASPSPTDEDLGAHRRASPRAG